MLWVRYWIPFLLMGVVFVGGNCVFMRDDFFLVWRGEKGWEVMYICMYTRGDGRCIESEWCA